MPEQEENHDVFSEETTATTSEAAEVKDGAQQEAETQSEARTGAEVSGQQGEEKAAEPPAADGDGDVSKSEKMIPESRFKAAIKDVSDKLQERDRELATLKAAPRPDPDKDPQGAALHDKLEMSVSIMSETVKDYDETIAHFQEMAKANPTLNATIAAAKHPAKLAYDLAKKDQELTELYKLKDDPDLKEFKKWKADKAAQAEVTEPDGKVLNLEGKKAADAASKVPNLNRNATAVNKADKAKSDEDSELWGDHYSSRA